MTIDPGTEAKTCEICSGAEGVEACSCSAGENKRGQTERSGTLIDFKKRASELRIKGAQTGSVPPLEATKALAFGMMSRFGPNSKRLTKGFATRRPRWKLSCMDW